MKNYFSVLKLLFTNLTRKGSNKSSSGIFLVLGILGVTGLIVSISMGLFLSVIAPYFADINNLIAILFVFGFFIVIIFSLFSLLSQLYFSADSEFFLSLPISSRTIFFAKLSIVYLVELLIVLFGLLPALITLGISLSFGVVYYIVIIFAILIIPMFPLVFTSIFALPLMYVVSYLKNKGAIASIIAILLFGALMSGYMYFAISLNMGGVNIAPETLVTEVPILENKLQIVLKIFYPFLSLARIATLTNSYDSLPLSLLINALIFFGAAAILFLLAIVICSLAYKRGVAKALENNISKKAKGKDIQRSPIRSLVFVEFKELLRNTTFAIQCLSYIILCPIVIIVIMIIHKGQAPLSDHYLWLTASSTISFFAAVFNVAAQTAITRQGKAFYYSKIIPIDYKTQIKAKLVLYTLISAAIIILGICATFVFSPIIWIAIPMLVYQIILCYATNCFSVWFDLKNPKLDWATFTEAVKNNKKILANTFINMAAVLILTGIFSVLYTYFIDSLGNIGALLTFIIMSVLTLIPAVLCHRGLYSSINYHFAKIS